MLVSGYGAFTLGHKSLDKSLHMRLKTLLVTLFNGSVQSSNMWIDLSSDMRRRMCIYSLDGSTSSMYTADLR